jgi:hypothetical protein
VVFVCFSSSICVGSHYVTSSMMFSMTNTTLMIVAACAVLATYQVTS